MRLYTFINCYLSSIQQGIQTAHILGELVRKYKTPNQNARLLDYLQNHKTIIVCNGGNNEMISSLARFFDSGTYQYSAFYEDEQSLSGALTGVGILLPEEIYDTEYNEELDEYSFSNDNSIISYKNTSYEYALIKRIKSYRLAH